MYNGLVFKQVEMLTGIQYEEYLQLAFELGCQYVYNRMPEEHAFDTITSKNGYWEWWLEEWIELDISFVLDASCQSKAFRENRSHNQLRYNNFHASIPPRQTSAISVLINQCMNGGKRRKKSCQASL